ncbi:MAG: cellulose biosynthesis cyclic di-GMP-binding regulatory protein BcsB, partial [Methylomonas sp.]
MTRRTMLSIGCLGLILSQTLLAAALTTSQPLSEYMVSNEPLMLRHSSGEYSISIPISDRVKPESATMDLALTNSNVLKGNRSQMSVYVNDYLVGQIKLDPVNNNTKARIQVDREYLKNGYNKVTFKAAQHYTDNQCEDWSAPELWTNIDTVKSTFTLNYEAAEVTEKLSTLDELINDRLGRYPLSILRGDAAVSDHYLYWGALISQAVKLRLKYVPMQLEEKPATVFGENAGRFAIDPKSLSNDAVLIGTRAQIAKLIPASVGDAIQGPYLGIFRQEHDKTHFLL